MRKVAAVTIAALLGLTLTLPVLADGDGSPAECLTPINFNDPGDLAVYTAAPGQIVAGVCIKAGQLHTGLLGNGVLNECYTVAGVGTPTVTVTRIGSGRECQAISHLDVAVAPAPTTTVPDTTEPEETSSTTITIPPTTAPGTSSTTATTAPTTSTISLQTTSTVPPSVTSTTVPLSTSPTSPPATELPRTGISSGMLLALGLGLLGSGIALSWLSRESVGG